MSNLFYLPRVHSQPGAKLYFRVSGTSTPQDTYTDIDLTVPSSNPVVADADGYFDPIYLDPSLPDYRVIHTDGSNVDNDPTLEVELEPTLDDVPSSQISSRSFRLKDAAPSLIFEETDQTSDNQKWQAKANGNSLDIGPLNGAESVFTSALNVARNGDVTIPSAYASTIAVSESATIAGVTVATQASGSYTGTITGCTTSPTFTIYYNRAGQLVVLSWSGTSGTSNSTSMTVTGMPASIRPSVSRQGFMVAIIDNGTIDLGQITSIDSVSGDLTFSKGVDSTIFTGSGGKGVRPATIAYML